MNINWSGKNTIELELFFSTDVKKGLSRENYLRAKKKYGENIINSDILENQNFYGLKKKKRSIRAMLSRSVDTLGIIYLLFMIIIELAGIDIKIYIYLPFYIFLILSAFIFGHKSEKTYAYLYEMARPKALVIRQNKRKKVFVDTLVPGDVIILSMGDIVPADAKIVEAASNLSCLHVIERSEYNETVKQDKTHTINKSASYYPEFEPDILYSSDIIDSGNAVAVITATGKNTKIAQNNNFLKKPENLESVDNSDSSDSCVLQKHALRLSKYSFLLSIAFTVTFAATGILQNRDFIAVILTCLTVYTACFSEQMPVIIDFAVAYEMRRLADIGIIIKKPSVIDDINNMDAIITAKADYSPDAVNVFDIVEKPSVNSRIKFLREIKSKYYFPAVAISELAEMPLLNEAKLSFTSATTETGVLKNKASVITKDLSVQTILKAVGNSFLIYRNICNVLNFSSMIFISQYLLIFFAVILNGAYILNPFEMIWSGIGAGYVFTLAMCYRENNTKWQDLRKDMQNSIDFGKRTLLKRSFISGLLIFAASVLSFLICFGLSESKFIWEYINNNSMDVKSAQTAAFITYIAAYGFSALYYLNGAGIFRILKNKASVIGFAANLIFVCLAVVIQPVRDFLGFGAIDAKIAVMAVVVGLLPAVASVVLEKRFFMKR
ncbi:MAG: cation transporting ATPase C-terminal domain-containing protein [Oscillospiraceae bacterium]|nr:cation transporting ATPase C-terminal domain-containing protein [Oscillospiraceae bacterium]